MIPRTEMDVLEDTATVADVLSLYKEDLRERYPVYETSVDNIIGVVSMKQLLNRMASLQDSETSAGIANLPVREVMLPAYYVPDTMPLSTLLNDFTSNRRQIAIVLDEYGGTEGLITLEDILEEIVGDYEDEFTPRHRHIKKEDQHSYVINGGVRVTELEPKLNYPFPTGDYVTLGGLINHRLGHIASVGDVVELEGARLEVLEMDKHRTTKVLFQDTLTANTDETEIFEPEELETTPGEFSSPTRKRIQIAKPKAGLEDQDVNGDRDIELEKSSGDVKREVSS